MMIINQKKKFFCYLCNYNTNSPSDWLKHIKSKKHERSGKLKSTKCTLCDYESTSHWNIKQHALTKHSTQEEREKTKYYCNLCDVVFFCNAYKKKHDEGVKHKNMVLCMQYQNELIEREKTENK